MTGVSKLRERLAKAEKQVRILTKKIELAQIIGPKRESVGGARPARKAAKKAAKKATKRR